MRAGGDVHIKRRTCGCIAVRISKGQRRVHAAQFHGGSGVFFIAFLFVSPSRVFVFLAFGSNHWCQSVQQAAKRALRRQAIGAVVPHGGKLAQRLKKRRCQHQHKQPAFQIERPAPGAEMHFAQQVKAHIHRYKRHAYGGKQFQYRRGEHGNPQHAHGALRQRVPQRSQAAGGGVHRVQCAQRGQRAQALQQVSVQVAEC